MLLRFRGTADGFWRTAHGQQALIPPHETKSFDVFNVNRSRASLLLGASDITDPASFICVCGVRESVSWIARRPPHTLKLLHTRGVRCGANISLVGREESERRTTLLSAVRRQQQRCDRQHGYSTLCRDGCVHRAHSSLVSATAAEWPGSAAMAPPRATS